MNKNIILIALIITFVQINIQAQNKDFERAQNLKRTNGIYRNVKEFINNTPFISGGVIVKDTENIEVFYKEVKRNKPIEYYNEIGKTNTILTKDIWGFCIHNQLYIKGKFCFHKILLLGSITYITKNKIGNRKHVKEWIEDFDKASELAKLFRDTPPSASGYQSDYKLGHMFSSTNKTPNYFVDCETGIFYVLNSSNLELVLRRDQKLHAEFIAIKENKRKDYIFHYIWKYNEKHPLF